MTRRSRRTHQPHAAHRAAQQYPLRVLALGVGILLIVVTLVSLFLGSFTSNSISPTRSSTSATQVLGGSLAPVTNGVQEVAIAMQGYTYQPNPIRVKVGVPVRVTVDLKTVQGCFRSIQIPELGVSARVFEGNNVFEFTPTKAGTFRMSCSMGMADGMIIVEDENGQVPAGSAKALPLRSAGGGSCGAGGCGCGG